MKEIEAKFLDEYKKLDAMLPSGVSGYIGLMEHAPRRKRLNVQDWDSDLAELRRLRRIRNSIAHDTGASTCGDEELSELRAFRRRVGARTDPLSAVGIPSAKKQRPANRRPSAVLWLFLLAAAALVFLAVRSLI